jgi:DNA-binding MarR family transcriptional regulator
MTHDVSLLVQDLDFLADSMDDLASKIRSVRITSPETSLTDISPLARAKLHYKSRRKRELIFGSNDLLGEPAWDMIVDLFIASEEGNRVSVTSLCVASAVPTTTALRWISILENEGIIFRVADETDARRFFLFLSEDARDRVRSHFRNYG